MKKILVSLFVLSLSISVNAQLELKYHYKMKNYYTPSPCSVYDLNLYYLKGKDSIITATKRRYEQNTLFPQIYSRISDSSYTDTISKRYITDKLVTSNTNRRWAPFPQNVKANLIPDSNGIIRVDFWGCITLTDTTRLTYKGKQIQRIQQTDYADSFYLQIVERTHLGEVTAYRSFPFATWQLGVLALPFKYHFGNNTLPNNLSTDINVGVYLGRKWGRSRFYRDVSKNHESASFTAAVFAAPTQISLKNETVKDTAGFKESDQIGLSFGGGFMYSYRQFNIGVFGGWDFPLSTAGYNWIYEERFWLGFGIGYAISILGDGK